MSLQVKPRSRKMKEMEQVERAEIWQGGMMVACVEGPSRNAIQRDVCHYAVQYAQEGPLSIRYSRKAKP